MPKHEVVTTGCVCACGGRVEVRVVTFENGQVALQLQVVRGEDEEVGGVMLTLGAAEIDALSLAVRQATAHKNRLVERGEARGWMPTALRRAEM